MVEVCTYGQGFLKWSGFPHYVIHTGDLTLVSLEHVGLGTAAVPLGGQRVTDGESLCRGVLVADVGPLHVTQQLLNRLAALPGGRNNT